MRVDFIKLNENEASVGAAPIIDGDILWFVGVHIGALVKYNMITGDVIKVFPVPDSKLKSYSYCTMTRCGSYLILFPTGGASVLRFNILNEQFDKIPIPTSIINCSNYNNVYYISVSNESKVVFVEHYSNTILEYSIETGMIQNVGGRLKEVLETSEISLDSPLFYWHYYYHDRVLYVPSFKGSFFVGLDLDTYDVQMYQLLKKDEQICSITGKGKLIYLSTFDNKTIIYNTQNSEQKILENTGIEPGEKGELKPLCFDDKIVYVPLYKRELYVRQEATVRRIEIPYSCENDVFPVEKGYSQFEMMFVFGSRLYIQARNNGDLFCVDLCSGRVSVYRIVITKEMIQEAIAHYASYSSYFETASIDLDFFLKRIFRPA